MRGPGQPGSPSAARVTLVRDVRCDSALGVDRGACVSTRRYSTTPSSERATSRNSSNALLGFCKPRDGERHLLTARSHMLVSRGSRDIVRGTAHLLVECLPQTLCLRAHLRAPSSAIAVSALLQNAAMGRPWAPARAPDARRRATPRSRTSSARPPGGTPSRAPDARGTSGYVPRGAT
jgi:hypothetical protein